MIKTWSTPVEQEEKKVIPCALCGGNSFKKRISCEGFYYVECKHCGLVQMNPQPTPEAIRKRYGAGAGNAGSYLDYELANEKAFLRLQLLTLADAGFDAEEQTLFARKQNNADTKVSAPSFLDIGCATGALLAHLAARGWNCTGVEISAPQAAYARGERRLDIREKPLEENRFDDNSFDVVHASHLIEHLNDPDSFVRESFRILKKGGFVLLTTPNIAGFQARLFRGKWRSAIFDHLYLFSLKTLAALLQKHGFVIEKKITWGGLAAGTVPAFLKRPADILAKRLGFGDVMMMKARKPE